MSQIMEIDIKNVTVPQATVQKITQIILQNNQEIVDFSYSKEGLSEVFKEITGHKIKNPDRLIDEHHKLKEKLKEERHKLAKQNAKNHKWKI
jgi:fructose-specific phosphotransferase system component IIB